MTDLALAVMQLRRLATPLAAAYDAGKMAQALNISASIRVQIPNDDTVVQDDTSGRPITGRVVHAYLDVVDQMASAVEIDTPFGKLVQIVRSMALNPFPNPLA